MAAGGGGLAGAVTTILLWIATLNGLEVPAEVGAALGVILTVAGAVAGGWLAPSTEARIKEAVAAHMSLTASRGEPLSVLPSPEPATSEDEVGVGYEPSHARDEDAGEKPADGADGADAPAAVVDYSGYGPKDL